jgi:hypothetical protein
MRMSMRINIRDAGLSDIQRIMELVEALLFGPVDS